MIQKRVFIIFTSLCFILSVYSGFAGAAPEHILTDRELLGYYFPVVVVARVKEKKKGGAETNGEPPLLTIEVISCLKGDLDKTNLASVWKPFPHDIDWSGPVAEQYIAQWSLIPNPAPPVGSTWILSGKIIDGDFYISSRCRYQFSEETLVWVKEVLKG